MKIWIDDHYLGSFADKADVANKLSSWQSAAGNRIFYLYEHSGNEYSFADSWDEFLKNNIDQDVDVRIISATPEMLRLELVDSAKQYFDRLLDSATKLADQFYANPGNSAWQTLAEFIEGLDFICRSLELLKSPFDRQRFQELLSEMMQAMNDKDTVTIADLLNYEWSAWLQEAQGLLLSQNH